MTPMKYASTFTGIGGFDKAFDDEGWEPTVQVEINKACQKILARHWPNTPREGDIQDVSGHDIGRPDLLVGGFPCQDTSIAAPHRQGLDGARSGMFWSFRRLLDEHLRLADESGVRWVVIENPVGLLKSRDGRDFAAVQQGLASLGYVGAWRVVDSRFTGTPQRRERVLIVGYRGDDPRVPASVLADTGGGATDSGHHAAARGTAGRPALASSAGADVLTFRQSRRPRSNTDYSTWLETDYANTLNGFDAGYGPRQKHIIVQNGRARVLTLTEWERLQGFPDDWTVGVSNSARFTALGNAMNVTSARWLARRIADVDQLVLPLRGTA